MLTCKKLDEIGQLLNICEKEKVEGNKDIVYKWEGKKDVYTVHFIRLFLSTLIQDVRDMLETIKDKDKQIEELTKKIMIGKIVRLKTELNNKNCKFDLSQAFKEKFDGKEVRIADFKKNVQFYAYTEQPAVVTPVYTDGYKVEGWDGFIPEECFEVIEKLYLP